MLHVHFTYYMFTKSFQENLTFCVVCLKMTNSVLDNPFWEAFICIFCTGHDNVSFFYKTSCKIIKCGDIHADIFPKFLNILLFFAARGVI
jgi:hypothetical protein